MKKEFLTKLLMMACFVVILGGVGSCKDYSEENYSDLMAQLNDQNTSLQNALEAQKQELQAAIDALKEAQQNSEDKCAEEIARLEGLLEQLNSCECDPNKMKELSDAIKQNINDIAELKDADSKLNDRIDALEDLLGELDGNSVLEQIQKINEEIVLINSTIETIIERANLDSARIDALEQTVEKLNNTIIGWGEELEKVKTDAATALTQATANADKIEKLDELVASLAEQNGLQDARLDSIVTVLKDYATKEELEVVRQQADSLYAEAKKYTDEQIALVNARLDGVDATIGQLTTAMQEADAKLQAQLDELATKVETLKTQVAKNTIAINNLTGASKKLITSLIIQGTKNPVTGSIATPFGTRSNILAAYYGELESAPLNFPTVRPSFYVDDTNALTEQDLDILGVEPIKKNAGEMIIGAEGNAGTLYVTVNPNTVDHSKTEFYLVNSQDELSVAQLSPIESSDETLKFGVSRAVSNGFYEAQVTIAPEDVKRVEYQLNLDDFKALAKELVSGDGVSVSTLANTIQNTLNSLSMDAYGLKASWSDYAGQHSTYSQYGVAVTAVKPLSFNFGKDFNYSTAPGVEQVENFIGKVSDKVKDIVGSVYDELDLDAIVLEHMKIPSYGGDSILEVEIRIPAAEIEAAEDYYGVHKIDISDLVAEVYKDLQASDNELNELMDQVNYLLDNLKGLEATFNQYVDDLKSSLTSFLDKFNNKFCNLINSTNKALRPVLFANTNKGYVKLSQNLSIPTEITGTTLELIPSSYTMEYLAPAYKKLVGVTNVYKDGANAQAGDADCMSALNSANQGEQMATILEGNVYKVVADFQPGYVYEVVYTAVDYHGMVDAKKFYISVK